MSLEVVVLYIIPAVLILYGVALLILTKIQKRYWVRPHSDHRSSVKGPAE